MRQVRTHGDGQLLDILLVFESEDEREEFFRNGEKRVSDQIQSNEEELRRAYMEAIRKVQEAGAKARGELRVLRQTSILESDLLDPAF